MEHHIHGSRWDDVLHVMHEPFDEQAARAAYEKGEPVSVAGGPHPLSAAADAHTPESHRPAAWAVEAAVSEGRLRARFFNAHGVLQAEHTYERQADGRLLLTETQTYEYDDATDPTAQWSRATELQVNSDGRSRAVVKEALSDGTTSVRMVEATGVDLSDRWASVPAFGRWDDLLERYACPNQSAG